MMKGESKRFYAFGIFRIDVAERLLLGENGLLPLTPKAFETLLVLVENCGHVLGKAELMEKVWPDSFVEENNLAQNISMLRRVLSEGSGGQKFIETVPKRGYRFVADVRESAEEAAERPKPWTNNKVQAGFSERPYGKGKSFFGDVVIIGRAINFKLR